MAQRLISRDKKQESLKWNLKIKCQKTSTPIKKISSLSLLFFKDLSFSRRSSLSSRTTICRSIKIRTTYFFLRLAHTNGAHLLKAQRRLRERERERENDDEDDEDEDDETE